MNERVGSHDRGVWQGATEGVFLGLTDFLMTSIAGGDAAPLTGEALAGKILGAGAMLAALTAAFGPIGLLIGASILTATSLFLWFRTDQYGKDSSFNFHKVNL